MMLLFFVISCAIGFLPSAFSQPELCKSGCPPLTAVKQGPLPEQDLNVRKYVLATYNSGDRTDLKGAECFSFVSTKHPNITNAYNVKIDYVNVTSTSKVNQSWDALYMVNPNNSAQYFIRPDENGVLGTGWESTIILEDNDVMVEAGCLKIGGNPENCSYWWQMFGLKQELKDWEVLKTKIDGLGLSTQNVTFTNLTDCTN